MPKRKPRRTGRVPSGAGRGGPAILEPLPYVFPPGTKILGINPAVLDALTPADGEDVDALELADLVALDSGDPRRSGGHKYGAKRSVYNGRKYDSKAEARRARQLDDLRADGLIRWWQPKPGSFHLGVPENVYRPDFLVVGNSDVWIEDVKGVRTEKFRHNVRLWRAYGPCPLHLITNGQVEIIEPKGEEVP